jgi:glycogen synthase
MRKDERKSKQKTYKILFVSAEVAPFTKAGGIADVTSSLAAAMAERGYDVRIATPKHGTIKTERFNLSLLKENLNLYTSYSDAGLPLSKPETVKS